MAIFPCQTPPPLQPGDRLIAVAPSGTLREWERFEQGLALWRSRGYIVDPSPYYADRWGYLAGTDAQRRQALQEAWQDPQYAGILCVRGGWGAARLLEQWQWPSLPQPKWFIGFSDITALLWSLAQVGISGVHGPVLTTIAQEPPESHDRLWAWLEGHRPLAPLRGTPWQTRPTVQGYLLPANLTVATHLLGTPLQPDFDQIILALEDVSEAPYRIDRLLTQWRMLGILQRVKGIALGRFSQCEAAEGIPSLSIEAVLRDRCADLDVAIVADLPFGHDGANFALPVGVLAELDSQRGELHVLG
ncbi:MAG: S66 peptidase family protein [Prochlorotrichaceae cyanobacterium]